VKGKDNMTDQNSHPKQDDKKELKMGLLETLSRNFTEEQKKRYIGSLIPHEIIMAELLSDIEYQDPDVEPGLKDNSDEDQIAE